MHYLLFFLLLAFFDAKHVYKLCIDALFPYFQNILSCLRSKHNVPEILVYYVIHTKVESKLGKIFTQILARQLFWELA